MMSPQQRRTMAVRALIGVVGIMLILFALVQYNDPDFLFWFLVYAIGAGWCLLAMLRPALLARRGVRSGLLVCLVLTIGGTAYFWPDDAAWWRRQVIWSQEEVREGLGMAIVLIALAIVTLTRRWLVGGHRPAP